MVFDKGRDSYVGVIFIVALRGEERYPMFSPNALIDSDYRELLTTILGLKVANHEASECHNETTP